MSFLNPFLLLGLIAVAVPLLIHLINLRRPSRVRFSTLAFFEAMKSSTLKRIRLKKWLLLALRMAAILLLAVALARPFIPSGFGPAGAGGGQPAAIGILIDNSPGMAQIDRNGPFLDQALRAAARIISARGGEDRVFLDVSHGESLDLPPLTRDAALRRLEGIGVANQGNFLPENLERLTGRLERAGQSDGRIYLVTGASRGSLGRLAENPPVSGGNMRLQTLLVGSGQQPNVAVTQIGLENDLPEAGGPLRLVATVENFGTSAVSNYFLSLHHGGEITGEHQVELEAGESAGFRFEVDPDGGGERMYGFVQLEGDELTFDNRRYFSVRIPGRRDVLLVQQEGSSASGMSSFVEPVLNAALSSQARLNVEKVTADLELSSAERQADVVILDGLREIPDYLADDLVHFVQNGGGVLFLPSASGSLESYNRFLERTGAGRFTDIAGNYGSFEPVGRIARFREGHPVLTGIFDLVEGEDPRVNLPELYYRYVLEMDGGPGGFLILESESGGPVLAEQRFGEGSLIISAIGADPGWSDFPVKPLFAPLIYRTVTYLATSERGGLLEHVLGERFSYRLDGSPERVTVSRDGEELIPERRRAFQGLEISDEARRWEPGFAEVDADGEKTVIAVNQHTMESDFAALETQEVVELLEGQFRSVSAHRFEEEDAEQAEQLQAGGYGRELWYWFILGALLLLLAESLAARLYKAESIQ